MAYEDCGALQLATDVSLDLISGGFTPGQTMQHVGFLAKLAELNRTAGYRIEGTRNDGGKKLTRVIFRQPASRFETTDDVEACDTDNAPCPSDVDVAMEDGVCKLSKFTLKELRALTSELGGVTNTATTRHSLPGNDPMGYQRTATGNVPLPGPVVREIGAQIANDIRALLEQVNIRLLVLMQDFLQTNGAGFDNLTLVKADGSVNQAALTDIAWAYTNALQGGRPIVIGGSQILHRFFVLLNIACCNTAGVNTNDPNNRTADLEWWRDSMLNATVTQGGSKVFQDDQFFVMSPGTARFVQDNEFEGDYAPNSTSALWAARTVEIPGTGIMIDQEITLNTCGKIWTVKSCIPSIGLFIQPINTRKENDTLRGLAGSSGLLTYKAVQGA